MRKRIFDLVLAASVVIAAAPLWLVCAIAIRLESRGPILHRARRIGRNGRLFTIYKFRTMRADAARSGPAVTRRGDPRVTKVGRFLRSLKIDEMPQLINVLRGDMSIVGPRPEDPRYASLYSEDQRRVWSVRPGMASPAFIAFRHEEHLLAESDDVEATYVREILPRKLAMDLDYIDRRSFSYDLRIIGKAAASLVLPHREGSPV